MIEALYFGLLMPLSAGAFVFGIMLMAWSAYVQGRSDG